MKHLSPLRLPLVGLVGPSSHCLSPDHFRDCHGEEGDQCMCVCTSATGSPSLPLLLELHWCVGEAPTVLGMCQSNGQHFGKQKRDLVLASGKDFVNSRENTRVGHDNMTDGTDQPWGIQFRVADVWNIVN